MGLRWTKGGEQMDAVCADIPGAQSKMLCSFQLVDARCDTADELTAIFLPGTYVWRKFEGKEGVMSKRSTAWSQRTAKFLDLKRTVQ